MHTDKARDAVPREGGPAAHPSQEVQEAVQAGREAVQFRRLQAVVGPLQGEDQEVPVGVQVDPQVREQPTGPHTEACEWQKVQGCQGNLVEMPADG